MRGRRTLRPRPSGLQAPHSCLVALVLFALGCVATDRADGTALPRELEVEWRKTLRRPSGEFASRPIAMAADGDGYVWVADAATQQLWIVAATDSAPRIIGSKGGGPGEFRRVAALQPAPKQLMWAVDPGNGRILALNRDGVVDTSFGLPLPCFRLPWLGLMTDTEYLGVSGPACDSIATLWSRGGRRIATVPAPAQLPSRVYEVRNGTATLQADIPFQPSRHFRLIDGGSLVVLDTDQYTLRWLSLRGDTVRSRRAIGARTRLTRSDIEFAREELQWFVDAGGKIDWTTLPEFRPAAISLSTGDSGSVLVQRYAGKDSIGRVFDLWKAADTAPRVLHLSAPHHLGPANPVLVNSRLVVLHQLESGDFEVVVYLIGP